MEIVKKNIGLILAVFAVIITALVGISLAYFSLNVTGNENASGISIVDAKLHLTYEDGNEISGTAIEPSNDTPIGTKTIEVTNDGTENVYYLLHWQELYNELVRQNTNSEDELYMIATCTSYANYGTGTQAVSGTCGGFNSNIPTQNPVYTYSSGTISDTYIIKENISIDVGITHVYSVSVYFKNEVYDQNYNQGKQFYGSIAVAESTSLPLPTAKNSLSDYTWPEIKQLSTALVAGAITSSQLSSTYNISVGSEKSATINGENHTFRIVGLNHDVDASGKTLGMTFEQTDLMNNSYKTYAMKSFMSSTDSWDNSSLKATINAFPIESDLDAVITSAKKPCVESVSSSALTYVTSKLWIMSETEIAGTQTKTYGGIAEGTQYTYYLSHNTTTDRIKQKSGSAYDYWLRSAYSWDDNLLVSGFNNVNSEGKFSNPGSNFYSTVSICFCI